MAKELIKQVWPEWEIEGNALGRGSFGVVYKGVRRDHNVESYAAIKVISIPADPAEVDSLRSEGLNADEARTYFQDIVNDFVSEIQLMESLKGLQNIVSIEDYKVIEKTGEIGWNICIRMELLTPFSAYIRNKRLSEQEVIKLGCDICTALEICSKRNIIHRDVKPENIFINDFGSYKLGDFGIARKLENVTGNLSHKGAYNYMAPEVLYSTKYDVRVDIYSLGIVLYRLLNGNRLPFMDSDQQMMNSGARRNAVERRIHGEQLPAPCDASPAMADLILRACAFDPNDRFATATEMKHALQHVASGAKEKISVHPAPSPDNTISVRESPTEGDGSMCIPKTPPAVQTPPEDTGIETLPLLQGNKRKVIIAIAAGIMILLTIGLVKVGILPRAQYNNAMAFMEKGNYQQAIEAFEELGDYRDAAAKVMECTNFLQVQETAYQSAISLMKKENYQEAIVAFQAMGNYKDSATKASECVTLLSKGTDYQNAIALMNKGNYQEASEAFKKLGDYKDSATKAIEATTLQSNETTYQNAISQMNKGNYQEAIDAFKALEDYRDSAAKAREADALQNKAKEAAYQSAIALMNKSNYQEASEAFKKLGDYKDSAIKAVEATTLQSNETAYQSASALQQRGELAKAAIAFGKLGDYKDAKARSFALWDEVAQRDTICAGSYHTVGIKSNGTVVATGNNEYGQCKVWGWKDIVAVSAGGYHTVGLKSDGTVVAVGRNVEGQCNISEWEDIIAISAGWAHTVGLKSDGTVVAVGDTRGKAPDWKNIIAISAGNYYTVGLRSDGSVAYTGITISGNHREDSIGWSNIVILDAGAFHTVGLKSNGMLVAVGDNQYSQCNVSGWKNIIAITGGWGHTVCLKSSGTVVAVGNNIYGQCKVSDWKDIVAISAGYSHTVGLKSDGTVVAVGYNGDGQCNVSTWQGIKLPYATAHLPKKTLTASALGFLDDPVHVTVTLNDDGTIATLTVDASTQMEGIGLACEKEDFTNQFVGKKGPFVLGDGIDACTAATITSQGVVDAVNSLFTDTAN